MGHLNLYEQLSINDNKSIDEIRVDLNRKRWEINTEDEANSELLAIAEKILTNPSKKRIYDQRLTDHQSGDITLESLRWLANRDLQMNNTAGPSAIQSTLPPTKNYASQINHYNYNYPSPQKTTTSSFPTSKFGAFWHRTTTTLKNNPRQTVALTILLALILATSITLINVAKSQTDSTSASIFAGAKWDKERLVGSDIEYAASDIAKNGLRVANLMPNGEFSTGDGLQSEVTIATEPGIAPLNVSLPTPSHSGEFFGIAYAPIENKPTLIRLSSSKTEEQALNGTATTLYVDYIDAISETIIDEKSFSLPSHGDISGDKIIRPMTISDNRISFTFDSPTGIAILDAETGEFITPKFPFTPKASHKHSLPLYDHSIPYTRVNPIEDGEEDIYHNGIVNLVDGTYHEIESYTSVSNFNYPMEDGYTRTFKESAADVKETPAGLVAYRLSDITLVLFDSSTGTFNEITKVPEASYEYSAALQPEMHTSGNYVLIETGINGNHIYDVTTGEEVYSLSSENRDAVPSFYFVGMDSENVYVSESDDGSKAFGVSYATRTQTNDPVPWHQYLNSQGYIWKRTQKISTDESSGHWEWEYFAYDSN
ncbi:J domain-containing protein [Corynebacterium amycolatum]|uniref:J domain-containing protein n=1 Tax=Corynebacterium amycolatum TaxID=43765 RepID=UPI00114CED3C|nr:J domain-containing protein [Corynebacterium amycolatum]